MFKKPKIALAGLFVSAASLAFTPLQASATTIAEFDAMSSQQAVTFIDSVADKIADDIQAQDPNGAQAIKDYFKKVSPDTKIIDGLAKVVDLETAMKIIDLKRKAKDPKAVLLQDDPNRAEKLVVAAARVGTHVNVLWDGPDNYVLGEGAVASATTRPSTPPVSVAVADAKLTP